MRISDWSSDVCSSDLNIPAASSPVEDPAGIITSGTRLSNHSHFSITEMVDRFERGMAHRRQLVAEAVTAKKAREAAAQEQPAWLEPARVTSTSSQNPQPDRKSKIGRASCRERVCHYV